LRKQGHRLYRNQCELSEREMEVLGLMAEGLSYPQMAQRIGISYKAVEGCRSKIFDKLFVHSRAAAVKAGKKQGLL